MKKVLILAVMMVMVFGVAMQAQAELQNLGTDDQGNRLIYDTDFDITWYDFMNIGDWYEQSPWADGLTVTTAMATYDDWRLPTALNQDGSGPCAGNSCTGSEMGHLYFTELGNTPYGPLSNTGDFQTLQWYYAYWSGTVRDDGQGYYNQFAWMFSTNSSEQRLSNKVYTFGAMAVRDGMAVVPEPISSTLFLIGGATLGFRRFRKRNS